MSGPNGVDGAYGADRATGVDRATGTSERVREAWVAHHERLWRSLLACRKPARPTQSTPNAAQGSTR